MAAHQKNSLSSTLVLVTLNPLGTTASKNCMLAKAHIERYKRTSLKMVPVASCMQNCSSYGLRPARCISVTALASKHNSRRVRSASFVNFSSRSKFPFTASWAQETGDGTKTIARSKRIKTYCLTTLTCQKALHGGLWHMATPTKPYFG